jgi:uncharacterized protein (DUF433 family)
MRLEDYFDFLAPDDIRLKRHPIGIEEVLHYYLDGYTAEEIAAQLPPLSLEQIYATITYYLHNRAELDLYLSNLAAQRYFKYLANPSVIVQRLRLLRGR